jgi:predicted transcriptional regulator
MDINDSLSEVYVKIIKENLFSCPITASGKLKGILDMREATKKILNNFKENGNN